MAKVYFNEWVFEPFYDDPGAEFRQMFGCKALYYYGKLILVLSESEDDARWQKLLFPCERENHDQVMELYSALVPHEVLGKWLSLSLDHSDFEEVVVSICKRLICRDVLFGVIPPPKKKSKSNKARAVGKKVSNKKNSSKKSKKVKKKAKVTRKKGVNKKPAVGKKKKTNIRKIELKKVRDKSE